MIECWFVAYNLLVPFFSQNPLNVGIVFFMSFNGGTKETMKVPTMIASWQTPSLQINQLLGKKKMLCIA